MHFSCPFNPRREIERRFPRVDTCRQATSAGNKCAAQ